jgi:peroxiredoxin
MTFFCAPSMVTIISMILMSMVAQAFPVQFSGTDLRTNAPFNLELKKTSKALVVVFLSSKCPCSASHEQPLNEMFAEFNSKGIDFVAINSNADETDEQRKLHFSEAKLKFPVLKDIDAKWADQFKALKTPHAFVLNPAGEVIYRGGVDDSARAEMSKKHFLKDALVSIANGEKPKTSEGRALGCVISR